PASSARSTKPPKPRTPDLCAMTTTMPPRARTLIIAFGPKEEVLARVSRPEAARTPIAERVAQLKVVVDGMNAAE
ncbi:hypothetical protein AB9F39_36900, partial [Rhizobium leguminosarum]|uniref:hypothetical protein n=1 Tax=Rhizobium leguminosarum TaxID=384 RepID=UPI003F97FA6C